MPWLALLSEGVLIAAAIALALHPLRARGGAGIAVAAGSAVIGCAALFGLLNYAGLDSLKTAHAGAATFANVAGMPLIFIGLMLTRMPTHWQWYGLGASVTVLLSTLLTGWYGGTGTTILIIGLIGTIFYAWQCVAGSRHTKAPERANELVGICLPFCVGGFAGRITTLGNCANAG